MSSRHCNVGEDVITGAPKEGTATATLGTCRGEGNGRVERTQGPPRPPPRIHHAQGVRGKLWALQLWRRRVTGALQPGRGRHLNFGPAGGNEGKREGGNEDAGTPPPLPPGIHHAQGVRGKLWALQLRRGRVTGALQGGDAILILGLPVGRKTGGWE